MNILLLKLTLVFYLVAPTTYLFALTEKGKSFGKAAIYLQGAGFFFHTHFILVYLWRIESLEPVSSVSGIFFLISWLIVLALLIMEKRFKSIAFGSFASPLAFILFVLSILHPTQLIPLPQQMIGVWLALHLICLLPSLAIFTLLFGLSLMYLLQEKQIRNKILGKLFHRLPPLEKIDNLNATLLKSGFLLYTLGLLWGVIWAVYQDVDFLVWPSKEVIAGITWVVYAFLLHGRIAFGWRGRKASRLAILGFAMLMTTILGTTHSFF